MQTFNSLQRMMFTGNACHIPHFCSDVTSFSFVMWEILERKDIKVGMQIVDQRLSEEREVGAQIALIMGEGMFPFISNETRFDLI
jgi:hypothetical protein